MFAVSGGDLEAVLDIAKVSPLHPHRKNATATGGTPRRVACQERTSCRVSNSRGTAMRHPLPPSLAVLTCGDGEAGSDAQHTHFTSAKPETGH